MPYSKGLSAVKPEDRCFLMSSTHSCQLHVNNVNKDLLQTMLMYFVDGSEQHRPQKQMAFWPSMDVTAVEANVPTA